MIMKKTARAIVASLALGATCLATGAVAARGGGGGGHAGGGGHFGGGGFGGAGHFSGGGHFLGGGHFGGVGHFASGSHLRGSHVGAEDPGFGARAGAHIVSLGPAAPRHVAQPSFARPFMRSMHDPIHSPEFGHHEFTRNAFGDRSGWHHWSDYHDGHWHRWHGWYGPVFWPFLYGDILSFSLFNGDYEPFWNDDPDTFLSTIYLPDPYGSDTSVTQTLQSDTNLQSESAACGALAPGVTDLPIEQIRQAVHPSVIQNTDLDNLHSAIPAATAVINAACPSLVPVTPVDRLDAMQQRLGSMIRAVEIVRGPLQTFYDSLSEGQKAHLAGIVRTHSGSSPAALCNPSATGFAEVAMDNIERTTQPTQQQERAFEALKVASTNAVNQLAVSCPVTAPQTPVERMDAIMARLTAMSHAAEALRPTLSAFYAELTPAQRARFDGSA
jgi:hypothetical protein